MMLLRSVLVVCMVGYSMVGYSLAYPSGAPSTACGNMVPGHGVSGQTVPPPYTMTLSKTNFTGGESVTVTLQSTSTTLKGFLCQAHYADPSNNQEIAVGSFDTPPNTKTECSGTNANGVTHNNPSKSLNYVGTTLTWTSPSAGGHVYIYCTFVQDFSTFWVKVQSELLFDDDKAPITATTAPPGTVGPIAPISVTDCGTNKGCYRMPEGCNEASCTHLVTWQSSSAAVTFEMSAINTQYIALGFSNDKRMGDDSVVGCAVDNAMGMVNIQNYYNDGKNSGTVVGQSRTGLTSAEGYYTSNGRISCRFNKDKASGHKQIFALDKAYHLLVAKGSTIAGAITMHEINTDGRLPVVSPKMVNVDGNKDNLTGRAAYTLIKVHGCLMILAWVLSASCGIFMARYYKPMWPNSKLCGLKVWFPIHRALMITTVTLTITAFIIIFIEVKGYSTWRNKTWFDAHPPLGIIVTALCLANPVIALFRPHPDTPNRPIFNWVHWGIGTGAHVIAVVAIFLGMGFPHAFVPWWCTWIMVAWVIFHVLCEITLEIHQCLANRNNKGNLQEMELKNKAGEDVKEEPEDQGHGFKKVMLGVYMVVTSALVITLVVVIAALV